MSRPPARDPGQEGTHQERGRNRSNKAGARSWPVALAAAATAALLAVGSATMVSPAREPSPPPTFLTLPGNVVYAPSAERRPAGPALVAYRYHDSMAGWVVFPSVLLTDTQGGHLRRLATATQVGRWPLMLSPRGRYAAVGWQSPDLQPDTAELTVVDLVTGWATPVAMGTSSEVHPLAWSGDERFLYVKHVENAAHMGEMPDMSLGRILRVDVPTGAVKQMTALGDELAMRMDTAEGGDLLLVQTDRNTYLVDTRTDTIVKRLDVTDEVVRGDPLSPDARYLLTYGTPRTDAEGELAGGSDGLIRVMDLTTGRDHVPTQPPTSMWEALAWNSPTTILVEDVASEHLVDWDVNTGETRALGRFRDANSVSIQDMASGLAWGMGR